MFELQIEEYFEEHMKDLLCLVGFIILVGLIVIGTLRIDHCGTQEVLYRASWEPHGCSEESLLPYFKR